MKYIKLFESYGTEKFLKRFKPKHGLKGYDMVPLTPAVDVVMYELGLNLKDAAEWLDWNYDEVAADYKYQDLDWDDSDFVEEFLDKLRTFIEER